MAKISLKQKLKHKYAAKQIRKWFDSADAKRDAGQTTPDNIIRFDNIVYGADKKFKKWQLLDVYRPKSAGTGSTMQKLPVIVIVHGGGWVYGDKDVYQFYSMKLAQRGFAVVNYSYRLAPEVKFPASLEDTENVFRWICGNAEQYGFDVQNVFAAGDSAGAHILALYASALTNEAYTENFPFIRKKPLTLKGVALNCGKYKPDFGIETDKEAAILIEMMMPDGGTPKELQLIDAAAHITEKFPPAFVMTSLGDALKQQAPFITDALKAAGVRYEYRCYGTEEKPLWHVFHCDPALPEAAVCNDDECEFFKKLMN